MLIYLLRHGQTEYNAQKRYQGQRDIPLSAAGIAQLRQADFAPEVVYVTPLQRTAQTARVFFPGAKHWPPLALPAADPCGPGCPPGAALLSGPESPLALLSPEISYPLNISEMRKNCKSMAGK